MARSYHRLMEEARKSLLDEVLAQRGAINDIVRRHRGLGIAVFGSVARREDRADSDVDFLVRFAPDSSLLDLIRLQDELSDLLGIPVDVVSEAALKPRDREIRTSAVAV